MRTTLFKKIFLCCILSLIILVVHNIVQQTEFKTEDTVNIKTRKAVDKNVYKETGANNSGSEYVSMQEPKNNLTISRKKWEEIDLKYILQWTNPKSVPFVYMSEGRKVFLDRNYTYNNCFVTSDRDYLGDFTKFEVIVFAGPEVVRMSEASLPTRRSPHQKFVFASIESAENYPVCSSNLDSFFNWTWTYKLDSEAKWGYIVVRDALNKVIGPKTEMHWINHKDMDPVSDALKMKLKSKTKAAAWFVSNCFSRSGREYFVQKLHNELNKYNLSIDVYGRCGTLSCTTVKEDVCDEILEKEYYFYLSFENSFSKDYVTEKLLHGLKHMAVPIVYGGANYTRFMPDGIYLNARELGVNKLAAKMDELIKKPEEYAEYFRWHKYYSYHDRSESVETDDYCRFCSILFEEELVKKTTVYDNFRKWWDPPYRC